MHTLDDPWYMGASCTNTCAVFLSSANFFLTMPDTDAHKTNSRSCLFQWNSINVIFKGSQPKFNISSIVQVVK